MRHPERDEVEQPLIDQLVAMGWTHLQFAGPGDGRQTFSEVILEDRFRHAVRAINLDPDGQPWLDDERLTTIVNRAIREPEQGVQGNIAFTELLTGAELTVEGRPDWDDGLRQPVRLVDWEHPERNELLVVSQFRIDTFEGRRPYVVPDLVLFVNGLPFAVIECKNPGPTAVDEAITQLHGYASDAPDIARFTQLLIATDRETAQYGTITSPPEYFATWRLVEPAIEQTIRAETGKPTDQPLLEQEILVGEMVDATVEAVDCTIVTDRGMTAKRTDPQSVGIRTVFKVAGEGNGGREHSIPTRFRHDFPPKQRLLPFVEVFNS